MSMSVSVVKRAPTEEIADARLRHAQSLGGYPLVETANCDTHLDVRHEPLCRVGCCFFQ